MQFVDIASKYSSKITVSNDDTNVDGKSIMQMTMLAATQGTRLKIKAVGSDAQDALGALRDLIENKLVEQSNAN
jgi:phosphocarrier protein